MNITFTIPDEKLFRIVEAFKGLYPIPVDDEDNPLFTPNQWVKERIRQWIRDQVARYEQRQAIDAIPFSPDDSLVT